MLAGGKILTAHKTNYCCRSRQGGWERAMSRAIKGEKRPIFCAEVEKKERARRLSDCHKMTVRRIFEMFPQTEGNNNSPLTRVALSLTGLGLLKSYFPCECPIKLARVDNAGHCQLALIESALYGVYRNPLNCQELRNPVDISTVRHYLATALTTGSARGGCLHTRPPPRLSCWPNSLIDH